MAAFLVPNFSGLFECWGAAKGGTSAVQGYWQSPDWQDWQGLFEVVKSEFHLPPCVAQLILLHPKLGCDCRKLENVWFSEPEPGAQSQAAAVQRQDGFSPEGQPPRAAPSDVLQDPKARSRWIDVDDMERQLRDRLDLKSRQIWVLRIRALGKAAQQEGKGATRPIFEFWVSDVKKRDVQKEQRSDLDNAIDQLKTKSHRAIGVVGQLYESLLPAIGTSSCGDLRAMEHLNAHIRLEREASSEGSDLARSTSGPEATLYVNDFRDYYAFPIWVADRLWGILGFQREIG